MLCKYTMGFGDARSSCGCVSRAYVGVQVEFTEVEPEDNHQNENLGKNSSWF